MRFDLFVAKEFNISRNKASELIKSDKIMFNGEILNKSSVDIQSGELLILDELYVSRAALKLRNFFQINNLDISGLNALDIGSSAGGFLQILLSKNVKKITSIDIGKDQLDEKLKNDNRVLSYEGLDIRNFNSNQKFDLITADLSFISLIEILPIIYNLLVAEGRAILLFKPQFEVGKEAKRNKKGVVIDKKIIEKSRKRFEIFSNELGFILEFTSACQVKGKEGNEEFFYLFRK